MELLHGRRLLTKKKTLVKTEEALEGKTMIVLYFSASWCKASGKITRALNTLYQEAKSRSIPLEVIFISEDLDERAMVKYFTEYHEMWYAVPYSHHLTPELTYRFGVNSIPYIIVMRNDGEIISRKGREEVQQYGNNVLSIWNDVF